MKKREIIYMGQIGGTRVEQLKSKVKVIKGQARRNTINRIGKIAYGLDGLVNKARG